MPSPVTFTGLTYSSMIQFLEFAAKFLFIFLWRRLTKNATSIQQPELEWTEKDAFRDSYSF